MVNGTDTDTDKDTSTNTDTGRQTGRHIGDLQLKGHVCKFVTIMLMYVVDLNSNLVFENCLTAFSSILADMAFEIVRYMS